jgi:hypothetical protein
MKQKRQKKYSNTSTSVIEIKSSRLNTTHIRVSGENIKISIEHIDPRTMKFYEKEMNSRLRNRSK